MRFGIYLMRRGVLTAEQLIEALEEQLNQQPQLGQLAIEEGILNVREVLQVLRAQATTAKERFGDAAMELGLLDRSAVARLLMLQVERARPLQDILIDLGTLDGAIVQDELAAFRRDRERSGARKPGYDFDAFAREAAFEAATQLT